MTHYLRYVLNCFWLWLPPLLISFAFWPNLGAVYQPQEFWRDIPAALGLVENASRLAVIAFSAFLFIGWQKRINQVGWIIYGVGLVLYAACQWAIVLAPTSWWSTSFLGFMAPAYTPAIWLLGLGLIGKQVAQVRWTFAVLAVIFMLAHNAHAWLVFARNFT